MGQFLAIGLINKVSVAKVKVDNVSMSLDQLQEKMMQELHYVPQIYEVTETPHYYQFTLKEEIFQDQLILFLSTLYPLLYKNSGYYDPIINKLKGLLASEWLLWAKGQQEEIFQLDEYGMSDSLKEKGSRIDVAYETILLSVEGQIMMEEFGRQFNFLNYAMRQALKQFSLAGALRLYITG